MEEEQAEEIDILQSIYPEELEVYTPTSYVINIVLDTVPPCGLCVDVDYPHTYPAEAIPGFKVGIFDVESDVKAAYKYALSQQDLDVLLASAKETAQDNLGMPSVFTVVSQLKDLAEELHAKGVSSVEAEHLKQLQIAEEKEQAKFRGTPVTKESFAAWRLKFRAEMGWDIKHDDGELTGRQIFERGIAKEGDDEAQPERD